MERLIILHTSELWQSSSFDTELAGCCGLDFLHNVGDRVSAILLPTPPTVVAIFPTLNRNQIPTAQRLRMSLVLYHLDLPFFTFLNKYTVSSTKCIVF